LYIAKGDEAGIVSEAIAQLLLSRGIAMDFGMLQVFQRLANSPHEESHRPENAVCDETVSEVVLPIGKIDNFQSQGVRGFQFHPI
jgi:hypothetical protein